MNLYAYKNKSEGSLTDTLTHWAPTLAKAGDVPILLMAPRRCCFGQLSKDGSVTGKDGKPIVLDPVFDARAFSETVELRWLKGFDGTHRSVVLTCESQEKDGFQPVDIIIDSRERTYLLWGKGTGVPLGDWSTLETSQIGSLPIPLANVDCNQRVCLFVEEYWREEEYGNVVAFEERLIKLEVSDGCR